MKIATTLGFILATLASTAQAEFVPVTQKQAFLDVLSGKNLSNRLYGVELSVAPSGSITGSAVGWDITGTWSWEDGYFCRDMEWGGDPIGYNCQLVEVRGVNEMRFTTDRGAGDSASFKLR